jgi:DNA (cytosine-5)-methyltransferase 1
MSMAAFVDLTKADTPKTPTRRTLQQEQKTNASKSYHFPLSQLNQSGVVNDKVSDGNIDHDRGIYPIPVTPTMTRKSSPIPPPSKTLAKPSPSHSRLLQPMTAHNEEELRIQSRTPARSRGQNALNSTPPSRHLDKNGSFDVSFSRSNINVASPSAKRRCCGLNRPSHPVSRMSNRSRLQRERELEIAEEEDTIIDLTINDNFPISRLPKSSPKRGIHDLLGVSDGEEQNPTPQKGPPSFIDAGESPSSRREARARNRLTAPGIRRRLAALGQNVNVNSQGVVDLSIDSDSDEEPEVIEAALCRQGRLESELKQESAHRCSIIGPEDYLSEDEISKRLANLDVGPDQRLSAPSKPLRKRTEIEEIIQSNSRYRAGKSVELTDGNFLRIVSIFRDEKDEVFLSGHLLSRQNSCSPRMPRLRNELVWIVEISKDDFEAGFDAAPSEVRLTDAVRIRNITFTNQKYPQLSLKTYKDGGFKNAREEITMGPLFCRWKSTRVTGDRKQRAEDSLVRLTYAEADPNPKARIRPSVLRNQWRGTKTILGGSHSATRPSSVNLVSERAGSIHPSDQVQQYTFGDAFCGAGGSSSGAAQAGLQVKWGFDKDKDTICTYADNLGRREGAESLREDVYEFSSRSDIARFMVDNLHISPPCQPFSPAHTVPSEIQDEINQAALFSVWHLVERIKPRIVTIEETAGLVRRHEIWFNALINIFISLDYSVRWKVVRCENYGVAQQRKRLFIIAAG